MMKKTRSPKSRWTVPLSNLKLNKTKHQMCEKSESLAGGNGICLLSSFYLHVSYPESNHIDAQNSDRLGFNNMRRFIFFFVIEHITNDQTI